MISEADLLATLAEVSHETWMRQKKELPLDPPPDPDDPMPTKHDWERAADIIAVLKDLGIYAW